MKNKNIKLKQLIVDLLLDIRGLKELIYLFVLLIVFLIIGEGITNYLKIDNDYIRIFALSFLFYSVIMFFFKRKCLWKFL